jgi:hypothetical protein
VNKRTETYCSLNNLFGLVLPILGIGISCRNFGSLFLWTTPRHFDIGKLEVRMKHCEDIKLIDTQMEENSYQVLERS